MIFYDCPQGLGFSKENVAKGGDLWPYQMKLSSQLSSLTIVRRTQDPGRLVGQSKIFSSAPPSSTHSHSPLDFLVLFSRRKLRCQES